MHARRHLKTASAAHYQQTGTRSSFHSIGIGMKDGVPLALELRDSFGQISLLTLKGIQKNPAISANQFKFAVPAGADVFRQ